MGMVDAQRMLLGGDIVPEGQIQFIRIAHFSCNRGNRVVRFPVGAGEDKGIFIRVATPAVQHMGSQVNEPVLIFVMDSKYRQWPFYDACFHIFITRNGDRKFNGCFRHGEGIISALKMVMA